VECPFSNPNWVQALAAVALVVLTGATLLVLRGYARDTKTIADKSVEQIENAQRPFIALVSKAADVRPHFTGGWVIENQGSGAALNIRHSEPQGNDGWVENVTPLAKGDFHPLSTFNSTVMQHRVFTIEYESLSGTQYTTNVDWPDGVMRTRFGLGR
jgi:hypothetical protein